MRGEVHKPTAKERRNYRIAAAAAVILVLVMAQLLHSGGGTRRYERYRREAASSYQSGDYDRALSSLRKAEAIRGSEEVRMLMADCYEAQGNWDMALEVLRQMDRNDAAVTERIAALEQRRLQENGQGRCVVAGQSFDAGTDELDLSGRGLDNGVLQELQQLHALNRLILRDNAISQVEQLASLGGLRTLDLSGNRVTDVSPLGKLTNLRSLNLDHNPVTEVRSLYRLQEMSSLSLVGVQLPEGELEALSAALPHCAIIADGETEEVQSILLGGVRFSTDVAELNLSGLGLRDVSCLSRCTQLKKLDLSGNEISDLSPLMNLQQLENLKINGNRVNDLRPLMAMTGLKHLEAAENTVLETSALSKLERLLSLDLSDNPIRDFSGLHNLSNLESLRLENTGLGDEDLPELYGLRRLGSLHLERNEGITAEAMKALKDKLPDCVVSHATLVLTIQLGGEDFRTDVSELRIEGTELQDLFGLEKFECLETVRLGRNRIENLSAFQNTHSRESIRSLDLSFNRIQDLSPLTALHNLETLDLRSNQISSINPLLRMPQLKKLDLSGNPLEQSQIEELRRTLPDCEILFS